MHSPSTEQNKPRVSVAAVVMLMLLVLSHFFPFVVAGEVDIDS
jgi:hypothetical protein